MKEAVEVAKQNGSYDSSVLYPMTLKSPVGMCCYSVINFLFVELLL